MRREVREREGRPITNTFETVKIEVAYLLSFFVVADYIPDLELSSLGNPVRAVCFIPLFGVAMAGVYVYRKQMLEIDKHLIFEEP